MPRASSTRKRAIIRKAEVLRRTGYSDSTIWRLERAGKFPARVRLGEADYSPVGWYEDEIDDWVANRVRAFGSRPPGVNAAA